MTPENDVNKESEQEDLNNSEDAQSQSADNAGKSPKPDEQTSPDAGHGSAENERNAESNDQAASEADDAAVEGEVVSEDQQDDIEKAANAQAQSNGGDDPLGFGDQRMEGDAVEGEDAAPALSELEQAEAKIASQADQLVRMQAEMENQRKRAQNDVTKAHKFALEKIALDLLPVRDSLEMGLQAATGDDADPAKIVEGSELTLKMLTQALEKYNIVEVNPIDEKFDPEFHQAMSMQPVEGKEPNTVSGVMQKGYTLNDRLIRPALVMVAK